MQDPRSKYPTPPFRLQTQPWPALPRDLREEASCQQLVDEAYRRLHGLDILVCNAARQQARESILDLSSEDFDATMKTNLYARSG